MKLGNWRKEGVVGLWLVFGWGLGHMQTETPTAVPPRVLLYICCMLIWATGEGMLVVEGLMSYVESVLTCGGASASTNRLSHRTSTPGNVKPTLRFSRAIKSC